MGRKRARIAVFAAAGTAGLMVAGSAAPQAGQKLDLSSRTAILGYLKAKGIQPSAIVFQNGPRNYAGPNCPGKAWNCTKAKRVVQIATKSGSNSFECTPSSGGSSSNTPTSQTCDIVQVVPAGKGNNRARCVERIETSTAVSNVTQSCNVDQSNDDGNNYATVDMSIKQTASGSTLTAQQNASVFQQNESGDNHLHLGQHVDQSATASGPGPITQVLEAGQSAFVGQSNDSGDNFSHATQSAKERANASAQGAGTVSQCLNGDPETGDFEQCEDAYEGPFKGIAYSVGQDSQTGKNESHLRQVSDLEAKASSVAGNIGQTLGSPFVSVDGNVEQNFSGGEGITTGDLAFGPLSMLAANKSHSTAKQDEDQRASADTAGLVDQREFGPVNCCSNSPGGQVNIDQRSDLRSDLGSPGVTGVQDDLVTASCDTSGFPDGKCTTHSVGSINFDSATARCQNEVACSEFVECTGMPAGGACASSDDISFARSDGRLRVRRN